MEQLDLTFFCKTKAQATDFSSRLSNLSAMIYKTGFNLEKALTDELGIQKKDKFIALLRDNRVPVNSQTGLKDFLTMLQEKVAALPVLSLTLAFEPKENTLKVIADWFLLSIQKQVLFDISVDTDIVAGACVTYNGKSKNYSIKEVFQKILAESMSQKIQVKAQDTDQGKATPPDPEHLHLGR